MSNFGAFKVIINNLLPLVDTMLLLTLDLLEKSGVTVIQSILLSATDRKSKASK